VIPPTITSDRQTRIMPYSTAVAPLRSFRKRLNIFDILVDPLETS